MCKIKLVFFIVFIAIVGMTQNLIAQELAKDIVNEKNREAAQNWEKGRKYALVIGISKYALDNIVPLKYAVEDANAVVDFLKNESSIKYDEINLLIGKDATRENILRKLSDISNKIGPEDTFFMYYSGHGKENYLIPYNGDKDYLKATGIRWQDDIYYEINKMEAKQKILIIDSCHSGALVGAKQMVVLSKGEIEKTNINDALLSQIGEGLFVITSSRSDEISWENDKMQHGYFTYFLIEGLKGAADKISEKSFGNGDGYITADELYNYVSYQTNDAVMTDLNKPQHPRKSFIGEGVVFLGKGIKNQNGKSFLTITSNPEGIVFINGKLEGTTPITKKEIISGDYEIKVENKGYLPAKKTIRIEPGRDEILSMELTKSISYITINSIPWGKIYLDGSYIGITPLLEEKIDSGNHDIEIQPENDKFYSLKQKIIVIPNKNNFFSWELREK